MPRPVLNEAHIHPAIRATVANHRQTYVQEVSRALEKHAVVVVGMGFNPLCKKACRALEAIDQPFHYLEYGSYFNQWRDRNALKMWSGWPTFPMVFCRGVLIGGYEDLAKLIASGEFQKAML
jgi:monothiol glutaredoxin